MKSGGQEDPASPSESKSKRKAKAAKPAALPEKRQRKTKVSSPNLEGSLSINQDGPDEESLA